MKGRLEQKCTTLTSSVESQLIFAGTRRNIQERKETAWSIKDAGGMRREPVEADGIAKNNISGQKKRVKHKRRTRSPGPEQNEIEC
jgi:hypothetical protein